MSTDLLDGTERIHTYKGEFYELRRRRSGLGLEFGRCLVLFGLRVDCHFRGDMEQADIEAPQNDL